MASGLGGGKLNSSVHSKRGFFYDPYENSLLAKQNPHQSLIRGDSEGF